jgi:DNA repair exonuclease SbcCD ATPase subunit
MTSAISTGKDIEMGSIEPIKTDTSPKTDTSDNQAPAQTSWYGRVVTDISLYPAGIVGLSAAGGVAYTYEKTQYVAAAIFSFLFLLQLIVIARLYCLGKLKSFGAQNDRLQQELKTLNDDVEKVRQENLILKQEIQTLSDTKDLIERTEQEAEKMLVAKIKEIQNLNQALHETEAKLELLKPLYDDFKKIESQLSHEIIEMEKQEIELSNNIKNLDTENKKVEKSHEEIVSDTKQLDREDSNFADKLKNLEELVTLIKKEIDQLSALYEKMKQEEKQLGLMNKKAKEDADKLQKTEARLADLTKRFTEIIQEFKQLSGNIPELKTLLQKLEDRF